LSWTMRDKITTIVILSRSYSITLHWPLPAEFNTACYNKAIFSVSFFVLRDTVKSIQMCL